MSGPLYHKTIEAGKKVWTECSSMEGLKAMKREFGGTFRQFLFAQTCRTPAEAWAMLKITEI